MRRPPLYGLGLIVLLITLALSGHVPNSMINVLLIAAIAISAWALLQEIARRYFG